MAASTQKWRGRWRSAARPMGQRPNAQGRRFWSARDRDTGLKSWTALNRNRLPKAIFPVLPKLRGYLSLGAVDADADGDGSVRGVNDISAAQTLGAIIAVTGLAFEARIAGGVAVVSDGLRTEAILRAEIERGSRGVISFGIAGGLAPHLLPGQWVVASAIVSDQGRHPTDRDWSARLLRALPGAVHATIAGIDAPLAHPTAKRALYDRTGAMIVDMESHVAARIAAAYGVPFTACRVIVDPAHRHLPPAALIDIRRDGTADVNAVLRSVRKQPSQLPELMRLAMDAAIARAALRRGRALLGPALGFPEGDELELDLAAAPALS